MNIGGHGLMDHLRLVAPLLGLIAAVWALRMVLDFAGAPRGVVRLSSVTLACTASLVVAVLLIHFKRFGGYANVAAVVFLLALWEQVLVVLTLAFSMLTGIQTVYSAPEFQGHMTPGQHLMAHLTFALGIRTLFGIAMDFLLFWLLRKLAPVASPAKPS
jgi:hypothetical protein